MSDKRTYSVRTVCRSATRETWTITSDRPLDWEDIEDVMTGTDLEGVGLNCESSETDDEEDREILEIIDEETGKEI